MRLVVYTIANAVYITRISAARPQAALGRVLSVENNRYRYRYQVLSKEHGP
jgi:hypothetical protein